MTPLNRERLQKEFYKIQKHLKKTVLFVTHDVDEAIRLADRIAIMKNGELIACGSPVDLIQKGENNYIQDFLGSEYVLRLLSRLSVKDYMTLEGINVNSDVRIGEESTVSNALSLMISGNLTAIDVVDEHNNTVGCIAIKDILKIFAGDVK